MLRNKHRQAWRRLPDWSLVTRLSSRILWLLCLVLPQLSLADGGVVRTSQLAGPFVITVLSSPTPLRIGPADFSVLVQMRDSRAPVLDADVALRLAPQHNDAPAITAAATRQAATNKLLYAALVELPIAGPWNLGAIVRHSSGSGEVVAEVIVEEPAAPLAAYWPYLFLPPAAVVLFALHQWRSAQRAG